MPVEISLLGDLPIAGFSTNSCIWLPFSTATPYFHGSGFSFSAIVAIAGFLLWNWQGVRILPAHLDLDGSPRAKVPRLVRNPLRTSIVDRFSRVILAVQVIVIPWIRDAPRLEAFYLSACRCHLGNGRGTDGLRIYP